MKPANTIDNSDISATASTYAGGSIEDGWSTIRRLIPAVTAFAIWWSKIDTEVQLIWILWTVWFLFTLLSTVRRFTMAPIVSLIFWFGIHLSEPLLEREFLDLGYLPPSKEPSIFILLLFLIHFLFHTVLSNEELFQQRVHRNRLAFSLPKNETSLNQSEMNESSEYKQTPFTMTGDFLLIGSMIVFLFGFIAFWNSIVQFDLEQYLYLYFPQKHFRASIQLLFKTLFSLFFISIVFRFIYLRFFHAIQPPERAYATVQDEFWQEYSYEFDRLASKQDDDKKR